MNFLKMSSYYATNAPAAGDTGDNNDLRNYLDPSELKTFDDKDISSVHFHASAELAEELQSIIINNLANTPEGRARLIEIVAIFQASCTDSITLMDSITGMLSDSNLDFYSNPNLLEAINHMLKHFAQLDQQVVTRLDVLKDLMSGLKFVRSYVKDWIREHTNDIFPVHEKTITKMRLVRSLDSLMLLEGKDGISTTIRNELKLKFEAMITMLTGDTPLTYEETIDLIGRCDALILKIRQIKQETRIAMRDILNTTITKMVEIQRAVNYTNPFYQYKAFEQIYLNTILKELDGVFSTLAVLDSSSAAIADTIPLAQTKLKSIREGITTQLHSVLDNAEFSFSDDLKTAIKSAIPLDSSYTIEKMLTKMEDLATSNETLAPQVNQLKFMFNGMIVYGNFASNNFNELIGFSKSLSTVLDLKIEHATAVMLQDKIAYDQFLSYFGLHIKQYYNNIKLFPDEADDGELNMASRELIEAFTFGKAVELELENMKIAVMAVFAVMHKVLGCEMFLNTLILNCPQGDGANVQLVSCNCPVIQTTEDQYKEMLLQISSFVDAQATALSTNPDRLFNKLNLENSTSIILSVKEFLKDLLDKMVTVQNPTP